MLIDDFGTVDGGDELEEFVIGEFAFGEIGDLGFEAGVDDVEFGEGLLVLELGGFFDVPAFGEDLFAVVFADGFGELLAFGDEEFLSLHWLSII